MTRKQALDKAADMLLKAQSNTIQDSAVQKYMSLAQLYMTLAHEMGLSRGAVRDSVAAEGDV